MRVECQLIQIETKKTFQTRIKHQHKIKLQHIHSNRANYKLFSFNLIQASYTAIPYLTQERYPTNFFLV